MSQPRARKTPKAPSKKATPAAKASPPPGSQRRDVERVYSTRQFAAKLRRLADALEQEKPFKIQVAGKRFTVPADARISVEHERGEDSEELEFQLVWTPRAG